MLDIKVNRNDKVIPSFPIPIKICILCPITTKINNPWRPWFVIIDNTRGPTNVIWNKGCLSIWKEQVQKSSNIAFWQEKEKSKRKGEGNAYKRKIQKCELDSWTGKLIITFHSFIFYNLTFILDHSWFTMSCYFQVYRKVIQMYPFFSDSLPIRLW